MYSRVASSAMTLSLTPDVLASQLSLLLEAQRQVDVHTATLYLGQVEGSKGEADVVGNAENGSYWFRAWQAMMSK
jgi:hypothetical protein